MSDADPGEAKAASPASEPQKPAFNTQPSGGGLGRIGGLFGILAVIALVLSAAAVGITLSRPSTSQSPAASIVTASSNSTSPGFMSYCGINGANLSISVPGAGIMAVEATVSGYGVHAYGYADQILLTLSTTWGDCSTNVWTTTMLSLDTAVASENFAATGQVFEPFPISSSGTYTFHVNAYLVLGDPGVLFPDDWWYGVTMTAVFYPS